MFFGFLVYLGGWVAPVLLTDWQIRGTAVRVQGAEISDGSCNGKLFVQICDVTLAAPVGSGRVERRVHYVFGSTNVGDFEAAVVADPAHPEWLSTDLGLDYFWNRVLSLAVACTLVAGLVAFGSVALIRNSRRRRAWRNAPAVAVPLKLTSIQRSRTGVVWTVKSEAGRSRAGPFPARRLPSYWARPAASWGSPHVTAWPSCRWMQDCNGWTCRMQNGRRPWAGKACHVRADGGLGRERDPAAFHAAAHSRSRPAARASDNSSIASWPPCTASPRRFC